jgi:hypothetical protein
MKTYPLNKVDAEDVADQLETVLADRYGFWDAPDVRVMKSTNKLIITAKPDQYKVAESYLDALTKNWKPKSLVLKSADGVFPSRVASFLETYRGAADGAPGSWLLRERVAMGIAQLVKDGKLDDAKKLADRLVSLDPKYVIGVRMRDTLADKKLDPKQRDERIAALAAEAKKVIENAAREARLRRRLEERLYTLATAGPATTRPADLTFVDGAVRVSVLLKLADDAAQAALTNAGFKSEATVKSANVVVGLAPPNKLADITLLDGVRRIEPTAMK